jgi:hypothetical protein
MKMLAAVAVDGNQLHSGRLERIDYVGNDRARMARMLATPSLARYIIGKSTTEYLLSRAVTVPLLLFDQDAGTFSNVTLPAKSKLLTNTVSVLLVIVDMGAMQKPLATTR